MIKRRLKILTLCSWFPNDSNPTLGNFVKKHIDLVAQKHFVTVIDLQADTTIKSHQISKKSTNNFHKLLMK